MEDKILISLTEDLFQEYFKLYFKKHPKAKKQPLGTKKSMYSVLSLNDLLPIHTNDYAIRKQKWGDFGIWVAEQYGYSNKNIGNSMIELRLFAKTKALKDNDNVAGGYKLFGDGFAVQSGMFIDDNYNHINPLLIACDYDKTNPRLEIRITTFEDDEKDIYKKLEKHIKLWE